MIFYFSATGNTRWAAIRLASITKEKLVYIPEVINGSCRFNLTDGERIGFVFPVHGWRVPKIVRQFISKLQIEVEESVSANSIYTFSVCTAGDNIGLTMQYLDRSIQGNKSLKSLGIDTPDSAYSLIMPETYIGLPFMDVDTTENEQKKINESAKQLEIICREIYNKEKGVRRLEIGPIPWINSKVIGGFFEKVLITDRPFHVNKDKCIKCGICVNVCPVKNIEGGHGKSPIWLHHEDCLTCFNCYHHCPEKAIEYGHRTKGKGQYYYGHRKNSNNE